jgi:uncharacterized protein YcbK (DUF882 family)
MERIKLTEHFYLDEYIPKEIYLSFYSKSKWFLDPRLPILVEEIRKIFGIPLSINDWHQGGKFNYSGYRPPSSTVGATYSQHKFGRAADLHFNGVSSYEPIRNQIRKNFFKLKEYGLTTIEQDTEGWLHIDTRWTGLDTLLEVPYK